MCRSSYQNILIQFQVWTRLDTLSEFTIFQNSSINESTRYEKDHLGNDRLRMEDNDDKN